MTEPPGSAQPSASRDWEFQDHHYHDEEPEIQNDETGPRTDRLPPRKKNVRRPLVRRRFPDEE